MLGAGGVEGVGMGGSCFGFLAKFGDRTCKVVSEKAGSKMENIRQIWDVFDYNRRKAKNSTSKNIRVSLLPPAPWLMARSIFLVWFCLPACVVSLVCGC